MKDVFVIKGEIIEALKETDYSVENTVWLDEDYYVEFYVSSRSDYFDFEIINLSSENESEEDVVFQGGYQISKALEEIDEFVEFVCTEVTNHKQQKRKYNKCQGAWVDCQTVNMFRFRIPEKAIGRNDITLYIEYGVNTNDRKQVAYSVWAQFDNMYVRALLDCDSFVGTIDDNTVCKIVEQINSSEYFYERLYEFVEHFDK